MIRAGLMRERVTVQAPSESRNMTGEATLAWQDVGEVWASVDGLSSREVLQAMQANAIASHKVRMRFFPSISHEHRLLWRGRNLEIASVTERENRTMHEILVREVQ